MKPDLTTIINLFCERWQEIALLVFRVGILCVGKNQMCYLCVGFLFQFSSLCFVSSYWLQLVYIAHSFIKLKINKFPTVSCNSTLKKFLLVYKWVINVCCRIVWFCFLVFDNMLFYYFNKDKENEIAGSWNPNNSSVQIVTDKIANSLLSAILRIICLCQLINLFPYILFCTKIYGLS